MLILLLIAFIAYVVAELYVLIQVGQAIGALNTIGLMILISLVGVWLAKLEGLQVLTRLRQQIDAKRMPTDELIDGGLILMGGLGLILPGFISDAIGIFVLFPPTRALVRGFTKRRLRIVTITSIDGPYDPRDRPPDDPDVIDV
jgi:UPF0716 protein FxsA